MNVHMRPGRCKFQKDNPPNLRELEMMHFLGEFLGIIIIIIISFNLHAIDFIATDLLWLNLQS